MEPPIPHSHQPRLTSFVVLTLLLAMMPLIRSSPVAAATGETPPASCHVTRPNDNRPPDNLVASSHGSDFYGNGKLWLAMWWKDGIIRAGTDAGIPQPGGVSIKTPWFQGASTHGDLLVSGRRLDGPAPVINQQEGLGEGWHVTGVVYPTPGCWQVSGSVGPTAITFVAWVTFTDEIARAVPPTRLCPVTRTHAENAGTPEGQLPNPAIYVGHGGLWVQRPADGLLPVEPPGPYARDQVYTQKVLWYRDGAAQGTLAVTGHSFGEPRATLHASILAGYGDSGLQVTTLAFPVPGCWEITGTSGTATLTFVVYVVPTTPATSPSPTPSTTPSYCPVTTNADGDPGLPQYVIPGVSRGGNGTPAALVYPTSDDFFGENGLWVGLWPEGIIRLGGAALDVNEGGGIGMKFWMYRDDSAKGIITISGHRLNGAAPPLTASVPEGYGDVGFQATGINFPTPGCWEVTVHSGTAKLMFVTLVEIVPAGTPASATPTPAQSQCAVTTNTDGDAGRPQYLILSCAPLGERRPGRSP